MVDLVLRPSGLAEKHDKPWSLQLRYGGMPETTYHTLCRVSDDTAREIIEAGNAFWLFGEPNWDERFKLKQLERARFMREEADQLEKLHKPKETT